MSGLVASFVRFSGVGAFATAVQYLVLVVLVELWGADAALASGIGFALSAVLNYLLNRRFTFRSERPHRQAFSRFVLVAGSGLALNTLLMWIGTHGLHIGYLIVQVAATGLVLLFNFTLNRSWVFGRPEEG